MNLDTFISLMLPSLEAELHRVVALAANGVDSSELHKMLTYHLGWTGEGAGPQASGKQVRPLLTLLTTAAAGGKWEHALPAAAGVELLHSFTLIHDDIEDNSPLRRGRPTVWAKWGMPQAINTGDAMFTLAHLAMLRLEETTSPIISLRAARILQETCLKLTQGQHLDIAYESRHDLTLEDYWPMVSGKTAALLAASTELGALVAEAPDPIRQAYHQFGHALGLAFQAQDDLLGVWGDAALIGKSAESDLVAGKKSLPILYGLGQKGPFAERWAQGPITPAEVSSLADQLAAEGAHTYGQNVANQLTQQALQTLQDAHPSGEAGEALSMLANKLLGRKS